MTLNVRDRVFSVADMISFECPPTVQMVQAAAGVSVSEATQYLAEWEEDQRYRLVQTPGPGSAREQNLQSSPRNSCLDDRSSKADDGHATDDVTCFNPGHQEDIQKLAVRIQRLESAFTLLANQFERVQAERNAANKQ